MIYIIVISIIIAATFVIRFMRSPKYINARTAMNHYFDDLNDAYKNYFSEDIRLLFHKKYDEAFDLYSRLMFTSKKVKFFLEDFQTLDKRIPQINEAYVNNELVSCEELFKDIAGKSLDMQQRRAVITDEINNLVIAGAGSGKTMTIVGKVKYLVDEKKINPADILLISFTKKASTEMTERLQSTLGINLEAKTFHSLGLSNIQQHRTESYDIADNEVLLKVIGDYFKTALSDNSDAAKSVIEFLAYHLSKPVDMSKYDNLGEYYTDTNNIDFDTLKYKYEKASYENNLKRNSENKINNIVDYSDKLFTLKHEKVKSQEEVRIANFLFLKGIQYQYEAVYPYPVNDNMHRKYKPDFYLPEYDIYIEHFGINKDGKASWLSEIEETKYLDSIAWKRKVHAENATTLVETYSYLSVNGELLTVLESQLLEADVIMKPINYQEVYDVVFADSDDRFMREFQKLISSFICLFKANGYTSDDFNRMKEESGKHQQNWLRERELRFFEIVQPIFDIYEAKLASSDMIDFNDMILTATDIVARHGISNNYRYVIIDEFQDISAARYKLVKAIIDTTKAKLVCVGDDWQSIYRFAGSDIEFFYSFESYFGKTEKMLIEKTYRNSQELIDAAGSFIMENSQQIKKILVSDKHIEGAVQTLVYSKNLELALEIALDNIVLTSGKASDVLLLGRTKYDILPLLSNQDDDNFLKVEESKQKVNGILKLKCRKYPNLRITFMTAHKSKGLEFENVVLLNMANTLLGFPNQMSDDPILTWVLTNKDEFPYAEERRLFYVAITRTKCRVYLLAPEENYSPFLWELVKKNNLKPIMTKDCQTREDNPKCPRCKTGALVIRNNTFLGCSNYPQCDYTLKDINILDNPVHCKYCGGFMISRDGPYGQFLGCSNYPYCRSTLRINDLL